MNNENPEDLLHNWNKLNKHNAEQDLASAMFASVLSTSPIIDKFSSWLLAGTGATAAVFITNVKEILPFLTQPGFKTCGVLLVVSGLFGFLAKYKAIMCQISYQNDIAVRKAMLPILDKHEGYEIKIVGYAKEQGVKLETDINMDLVINEFCNPFPKWVGWLMKRYLRKNKDNRQIGYVKPIQSYHWQFNLTLLQTVTFIAFVITGVFYAQTI